MVCPAFFGSSDLSVGRLSLDSRCDLPLRPAFRALAQYHEARGRVPRLASFLAAGRTLALRGGRPVLAEETPTCETIPMAFAS